LTGESWGCSATFFRPFAPARSVSRSFEGPAAPLDGRISYRANSTLAGRQDVLGKRLELSKRSTARPHSHSQVKTNKSSHPHTPARETTFFVTCEKRPLPVWIEHYTISPNNPLDKGRRGTIDNSPAVHCWEGGERRRFSSPEGTIEGLPRVRFQSSLRDFPGEISCPVPQR
jgi:hypothetical protein